MAPFHQNAGIGVCQEAWAMKAYKFETTVQDNGVIRIPEMIKFANQRVEVFVVVSSTTQDTKSTQPIAKFL